jgi:tRNA threonylcarbamoyl adenosine modification protein YeaZ
MLVTDGPLILAVETSSRVGSVALACGPNLREERVFSAPMQHSAEIFPAIAELLGRHGCTPAQLEQVHISLGPGSFTGLRIAVAMAKAMYLASGVRIVTVDSLDVVTANLSALPCERTAERIVGQEVTVPERVAALFDAKRSQFYGAVYEYVASGPGRSPDAREEGPGYRIVGPNNGSWQKILPDCLITARELVDRFAGTGRLGLLGDGLLYHREEFRSDNVLVLPESCWSPHAANVHALGYQKAAAGRFEDPLALTPFYLRGAHVTLKENP